MVLVLSRQDVAELVSMPALVEAVEKGLIEVSAGTAINPNRLRVFVPEHQAMMACMPAYLGQANALGAKIVSSSSRKPAPGEPRPMSALTVLADTDGRFLSIMCGTHLGALRTAAASAVAIRHLATKVASSMAIIGCGVQGRAELAGALAVRKIDQVFAFDTDPAKAKHFRASMTERYGIAIQSRPAPRPLSPKRTSLPLQPHHRARSRPPTPTGRARISTPSAHTRRKPVSSTATSSRARACSLNPTPLSSPRPATSSSRSRKAASTPRTLSVSSARSPPGTSPDGQAPTRSPSSNRPASLLRTWLPPG